MNNDLSNYTVLIAEDDEISFKYLQMVLSRKTKIKVLWAINGQMAVDFCEQYEHIDIIMMDIQLPVLNGIEAIRQIRQIKPEIPIIVHTANAYGDDYAQCYEAGCDDFITKPININYLLYKIDHLLQPVNANQ